MTIAKPHVWLACILLAGCGPKEDPDVRAEPAPKASALEGTALPELTGDWRSVDGRTSMRLAEDGTGVSKNEVSTPEGKKTVESANRWAATSTDFSVESDGRVAKYRYSLEAKKLTLELSSGGKIVYAKP